MTYPVRFSQSVDRKRLKKFPADEKRRLHEAIHKKLAIQPLLFGKHLRKSLSGARSLRVGSYRIIYRFEGKFVEILLIGHRSTVYKDAGEIF